jgi:hypothetical protein
LKADTGIFIRDSNQTREFPNKIKGIKQPREVTAFEHTTEMV